MLNISIRYIASCLLLFASPLILGDVLIDRSIIDVTAGEARRSDFHVLNQGSTDSEVSIELYRVLNPGLPNEERVSPENPRDMGLLATPRQFTLAAGERRKVRLSFLHLPTETDAIYRILVKPSANKGTSSKASQISVVFNYELLLILRPPSKEARYLVSSTDQALTFTHTGNSNFLLYAGRECPNESNEEQCQPIPAKRLYAGASHSFPLQPDTRYVNFLYKDDGEARLIEFCGQPLKSCTVKASR
ncbi:P pilus assembly chaperone PapD [Litorivivens lipolytica]|uniref:P pilus assembly chaperone PapD n=1 Tax=Litorivivens lipolytica TaxID=1524264 RepID=A0A7W4W3I2_9GAMM|nr:fimbria/pilus periplasmic chaperone [Litorivivens lipolytica]MBB3046650.1 P pilus assembly chaperone PapD [Litorivivens lipolytica]